MTVCQWRFSLFSLLQLPFRMRWQDLKDLFRKAGPVLRADVALSVDHRSKGHGTVLFATVQEAQAAIGKNCGERESHSPGCHRYVTQLEMARKGVGSP